MKVSQTKGGLLTVLWETNNENSDIYLKIHCFPVRYQYIKNPVDLSTYLENVRKT